MGRRYLSIGQALGSALTSLCAFDPWAFRPGAMKEPPPFDHEYNPLSAWAWDYSEYHNFPDIDEK
jgi:hypothetical protein